MKYYSFSVCLSLEDASKFVYLQKLPPRVMEDIWIFLLALCIVSYLFIVNRFPNPSLYSHKSCYQFAPSASHVAILFREQYKPHVDFLPYLLNTVHLHTFQSPLGFFESQMVYKEG